MKSTMFRAGKDVHTISGKWVEWNSIIRKYQDLEWVDWLENDVAMKSFIVKKDKVLLYERVE